MRTKRSLRRTAASVLVTAVASTGAVAALAGTANAEVCGQYVYQNNRYYSHCGSGRIVVKIVDVTNLPWLEYECMSPGEHYIGPSWRYISARSTGRSC